MIYARQSTAIIVTVGPVLDADGVAVTDCVVGDFKCAKNGAAPAALDGSATLTHRHTGHYSLSLTATDVNTVGTAEIVIDDTTNACPMKEIQVVEPAVYDALFADTAPGYLQPTTAGRTLDVSAGGEAGIDWGNVGTPGSTVNLSATTVNLVNTLTTYTGNTPQTGDSFARLGAPAGASVSADIAAIEAQTDDIGAAGAGLTAIPWNAAWDAEVQSEVQDAIEANQLDHLIQVADPGGVVANSSFLAKLVSKSATPAFSSYDNTTDSLEAARDNIGTAGAGLTAADDAVITLIGVAGAGLTAAGGDGSQLTAINLPNQTMDIVGNITGNLSGSVGSVSGAVGSIAADGITSSSLAASANGEIAQLTAREVYGVTGTVWHLSPSGNDANDGLSWLTPKLDAFDLTLTAGDLVLFGPGTHALGANAFNPPDGVSLKGAGPDFTVITSTANLASAGVILSLPADAFVEDLSVFGIDNTVFQAPVGWTSAASQNGANNCIVRNCHFEADTDGLYFRSAGSTTFEVTFIDCVVRTKFHCLRIFPVAGGGNTGTQVNLVNCDMRAIGPSNPSPTTSDAAAIAIQVGKVVIEGGTYEGRDSGKTPTAENRAFYLDSASGVGKIEARGAMLISSGGGTMWDVDAIGAGSSVRLTDCVYDSSKVSSGSGTVTVVNTRINMAGQIAVGASTELAAILLDTGTDGVVVNTFTTSGKAELQTEANDALVANNLDHLVLSAVDTNFATTVHANSVIGHIADNGAGFDRTTDSLEAIRDQGDLAWITSTLTAGDVWIAPSRTLTAATNITQGGAQIPISGGLVAVEVQEITAGELASIADAVLSRGVSNVQDAADPHSLCTIILATLESSMSSTTWTIRKTGGTTFTTKTLTLDASSVAITGVT